VETILIPTPTVTPLPKPTETNHAPTWDKSSYDDLVLPSSVATTME